MAAIIKSTLVEYKKTFCILGYHICKNIPEATVGENSRVHLEAMDYAQHTMAMEKNGRVNAAKGITCLERGLLFLKRALTKCQINTEVGWIWPDMIIYSLLSLIKRNN